MALAPSALVEHGVYDPRFYVKVRNILPPRLRLHKDFLDGAYV